MNQSTPAGEAELTSTKQGDPPVAPTIEARNLTKVFGQRTVVDRLSLAVYPGELYALLGDNGAGKTTTINMLTTLLSPTEGNFRICGYDGIKEPEKAKECFGVVSQDVAIYQELTAYENLAFVADLYGIPGAEAERRIKRLLEDEGLIDRANDRAGEFSMGMQRKLSIATAILHEPKVLFMDEPTVGLDPAARRQIWSSLVDLRSRGVTILLTTHYLEEAELLADRIGIIRQGKLVVEGTIDELREKIKGIRSISVRLSGDVNEAELKAKIDRLVEHFPVHVHHDPLRNTISFSQPRDGHLGRHLEVVLQWLKDEQVAFSKFATSEPSLEEVFLWVAAGKAELKPAGDLANGIE